MPPKRTRAKGVRYEREVATLFESYGFAVRGLEAAGDHLIVSADGVTLSSECKRQERLRIPEWWEQATTDAPRGTIPVLTFRQSRQESLSVIRTADLARLLAR
jgi:hypothetical protein